VSKLKSYRCISCRFYYKHEGTDGQGECRLTPEPIAKHEMHWCGQYQEGHELINKIGKRRFKYGK